MKTMNKGYGLKTGGVLLNVIFSLKRDVVAYAKESISNHPDLDWRKVYQVVKVVLKEVK